MDFNEAKQIIIDGLNHPYILFQKIYIYCSDSGNFLHRAINKIELSINEEASEGLGTDEETLLAYGAMFIPAIILQEDIEENWKLSSAIGLMLQNYGDFFDSDKVSNAAKAINKIVHTKNSLSALLIQTESVILQLQSALNNSDTPYKLSKKFFTSLFSEEND